MKRFIRLFIGIVIAASALLLSVIAITGGSDGTNDKSDKSEQFNMSQYYPSNYKGYRYPMLPCSDSWNKLNNHQEMVDACQIPRDILEKMTTYELVESIIAYPLYTDMFAYDNWDEGFEILKQHFNTFEEIETRKDLAAATVAAYTKLEPATAIRGNNGDAMLKVCYVSAMIDYYRAEFNSSEIAAISDMFKVIVEKEEIQLIPGT